MPIDASIIPTKQTIPNFGGAVSSLMEMQKNNLAIQQAQQAMSANQAASAAIQQNTDANGNVNIPSLVSALAKDPNSAYNLPTIMNQVYQMENAKNQELGSRIENLTRQNTQANQFLGGLMDRFKNGEKVTRDDYLNGFGKLIANKVMTVDQARLHADELPKPEKGEKEDSDEFQKKMKEFTNHHYVGTLANDKQLELAIPTLTSISNGAFTNLITIDKRTGEPTIKGQIKNTLSPADLARPFEYKDAEGKTVTTTTEKFLNTLSGQQGGSSGQTGAQGYSGRYPSTEQTQPQGGGLGGVATGLSPTTSAAMSATGTNAANQVTDMSKRASEVPTRVSWLNQAQELLANPNVNTGPGSDWRNKVKSATNALSPEMSQKLGITKDVQSYDELKKILTNYANMSSASMGTGTDSRLNAAITGNANPEISKMANQDIITKTKAIEQILAAKNKAFQSSGLSADKFPQWESSFNDKLAVEPFVFNAMRPEQRHDYLARLKEKDKSLQESSKYQQFKRDLAEMVKAGLIKVGE